MSVIAKLAKDWIVSDIGSSEPLTVNQAYDHSMHNVDTPRFCTTVRSRF